MAEGGADFLTVRGRSGQQRASNPGAPHARAHSNRTPLQPVTVSHINIFFPKKELCVYPGGGHGNLLLNSCLENPMDRGAWRATVHRVVKNWIRLRRLNTRSTPTVLRLESREKQSYKSQNKRTEYDQCWNNGSKWALLIQSVFEVTEGKCPHKTPINHFGLITRI